MEQLLAYFSTLTPALIVLAALLRLFPKDATVVRIMLHIIFFVLARDAMTKSGFWQLGPGSLRFIAAPTTLWSLASMCALLSWGVYRLECRAREGMRLFGTSLALSIAIGLSGALAVSVIAASLKNIFSLPSLPLPDQGAYLAVFVFSMAGNVYEEMLFRGLLQNTLAKTLSQNRAALVSGLVFCLCHSFLAITVTHIGLPILAFTLIEGLAAAFVYRYAGLLGAALTHGLAIFALAAAWY